MKQTNTVRREFLEYFKKQGHAVIASSPVAPHDDPTLLFTNAGMNQFKDVFLGKSKRDYTRATTSQKCIRAGGKHNDLENVGHTKRHLTFFEMLGNFSFGDYFKAQAIQFAWEVSTQVFGFDPDRIWPTVYKDDDEAFEMWKKYVPAHRITRFGEKENFWSMGDVGPCGPCSELLYDRGESYGTAKNPLEDTTGERFLEFWNLVFMQYNKNQDGVLEPLPKPSIDTGAGLERVMSLIQNTDSVFETDILRSLISAIEDASNVRYNLHDARAPSFRVIADHMRTLSFAIADGIQPSNVDRGYVLRKILRRAVRYGKQLGFEEPFLAKLLPTMISLMGQDYKELVSAKERIAEILTREEEAFFKTLKRGGNMLTQIIQNSNAHKKEISGEDAFKLKDTYGLPFEEVQLIAKDNDLTVDIKRYEALELEAKEKSRGAQKQTKQLVEENLYEEFVQKHTSHFIYDNKETHESEVIGLVHNGQFVDTLSVGQEGMCILKETLFYPEMGGQVGDTGSLQNEHAFFEVSDCKSPYKGVICHIGTLEKGTLTIGDRIVSEINHERRQKIANNHTATHLLHWALVQVLGEHARQAGSVVDDMRLRFDFAHHKPMTEEEITAIETLVNEKIRQNFPVKAYEIAYDEAQKRHDIKQFFGEKYGAKVRVIDIDFSKELCGGTHTSFTGSIGYFRISKESSVAAGIRRIEATSGKEAEQFCYEKEALLKEACLKLKTPEAKLAERLDKLNEELKLLQNELKAVKKAQLVELAKTLPETTMANGVSIYISQVSARPDELRLLADELFIRTPKSAIILACQDSEKAHLFIKIPEHLVARGIKANELVKAVLPVIEGNGGGKPDSATCAGKAKENLAKALQELSDKIACSP